MNHDHKAYQYAAWCLEHPDYAPVYVRKQCENWINVADGLDKEAELDLDAVDKMERLLKIMVHPDLHCPVYDGLEPYAWLMITATFCTMLRNAEHPTRYYITTLLEIARKNFKTFNSGVIFILLLLTEPPFSRFFSVAPDLRASSELRLAVRKIIKVSPALSDETDPAFKNLRSQVRCLINENEYTPLAYSEDSMDSTLANAFLADEAGNMDEYPIEAMRSSQITLFNKLGIIISTQYPNDNNAMITEIDFAKRVLDGLEEDRRTFSLLFEPDGELQKGDIWKTDDRVLYQANPVAVTHDYIMDDLKRKRAAAIAYENKRENFLCKHCNILYKSLGTEGFIDIQAVKKCSRKIDDDWWSGRKVWVGLDLSLSEDNTAVAMATEEDGILYARVMGFIPSDRVDMKSDKEKLNYKSMIERGYCIDCGDQVVDYGEIENYILTLEDRLGVDVQQVGYDRWNAISTVQKLEGAALDCVEIKQHSQILHAPTKLLKEKILGQEFVYDENRLLEINFENARCTEDTNLNKYVNKKKSSGKVDMVVALINAIYLVQQDLLYGNDFTIQVL